VTPHGPSFGRLADAAEALARTVERNVRAPADVEECAGDLMGVDINIAALAGRDR
jgi:hypothetical protein